jgi:uncharacterized RDD family membrane protein YckC
MNVEFEGLWRRFLAALIDNATWFIGGVWLLSLLPQSAYADNPEVIGVAVFALLTAWFNYFAIGEWHWQQTIGKSAMGMRVISIDRTRLTYGQASIRNLLRLVDFFVIGWVMIAVTRLHQRLGDKAAKTVVIRERKKGARNYSRVPGGQAGVDTQE